MLLICSLNPQNKMSPNGTFFLVNESIKSIYVHYATDQLTTCSTNTPLVLVPPIPILLALTHQ